jgi:hypothetical protein
METPRRILLGDGFQRFVLCHVVREVENKLYRLTCILVVVITIHVSFELTAVPDDPLPPLLALLH